MRVFSIFFHPNPSWSAMGGAEKRFIETLKNLEGKAIKITLLESKPSLLTKFKIPYQICELPSFMSASSSMNGWLSMYIEWILWILRACIKCLSIIRGQRYDVILSPNNTVPNLIPAFFASRVHHLPLCVIVHHIDLPSPIADINFPIVYRMYREIGFGRLASLLKTLALFVILILLRRSDACIAISNSTAKALIRNGVFKRKIYMNGNGVDISYIDSFQFDGDKSYDGVFVGRISKEKGVFDLLMAWRKLTHMKSDVRLLIIGSGLDIGEAKRLIKELHLERNAIVRGPCNDRDMYTLMKASKVFVFPSRFEGWGLAVAEALACGLPVVCYDIPALREVFGGCDSVFFVPIGDVGMLASAILRVLKMSAASDLATASKAYVKGFNWKEIAKRDLQIINLIAEGSGCFEQDGGRVSLHCFYTPSEY